jgi:hypothetical protein
VKVPLRESVGSMSKVVQLRAAVAPRTFALPKDLNLMSSDAGDRAGSLGLAIVPAIQGHGRLALVYGPLRYS